MVLKRVAAKAAGVGDVVGFIKERSPVPVEGVTCADFLRRLYPKGSGEKVVVFSVMQSQGQLLWKADARDLILDADFPTGPDGVWFLAQPVDGEYHCNPRLGGKPSRRSEESVTAWRYVVLESDKAEPDEWLRCLIQLPLRIASVCESGGRSIHVLVRLDAESKADWDTKVRSIKPTLVPISTQARISRKSVSETWRYSGRHAPSRLSVPAPPRSISSLNTFPPRKATRGGLEEVWYHPGHTLYP